MLLADLGASVVRVESPTRQDIVHYKPPFRDGVAAWHGTLNRSKRSLALDLAQPGAPAVVRRLVAHYDIVVEQSRPGVMDRLGVGYEALRAANPRLIYCALTGYGQDGPYRDRAGHDINYIALAGISAHSGRAGHGPPPLGIQPADIGAGSHGAVIAILAAALHRTLTGEGQFLEVSMFDGALAWNALTIADTLAGAEPGPEATLLNGGTAYDYFATADGRYLAVGALEPKFWRAFCAVIARPDLANRPPALALNDQALKAAVAAAIASRTLSDWQERFAAVDACVEPVLTPAEAMAHPQTVARGGLVPVPNPHGAPQLQVAHPLRFSRTPPSYRHVGPVLGAHTREVLLAAGFAEDELRELQRQGTIQLPGEDDAR